MDRRRFALGLAVALLGAAVLGFLAAAGAVRSPVAAAERTGPIELVSIAAGFLLATAGLVAAYAAYAADALEE